MASGVAVTPAATWLPYLCELPVRRTAGDWRLFRSLRGMAGGQRGERRRVVRLAAV